VDTASLQAEGTAFAQFLLPTRERAAIAAVASGHSILFHWDVEGENAGEFANEFPCVETIAEVAAAFAARPEVVGAAFGWLHDVDGQWTHATDQDTATCRVSSDDRALVAAFAIYRTLSPGPVAASLSFLTEGRPSGPARRH